MIIDLVHPISPTVKARVDACRNGKPTEQVRIQQMSWSLRDDGQIMAYDGRCLGASNGPRPGVDRTERRALRMVPCEGMEGVVWEVDDPMY